ncbi:MAG: transglutaminase family protein [Oscillospiraceae bacterium]|nr:transglutaminase family protein [Oscillospiraceae bacterium]
MKRLTYHFRTNISFDQDVTDHYFTLRCLLRDTPFQHILSQTLTLEPETYWLLQRDGFGNLLEVGCHRAAHRVFGFTVAGEAEVDISQPQPDRCNPLFSYASPLTAVGPGLTALFEAQGRGKSPEELMHLVHRVIAYTPGVTGIHTTAEEALALGQGVCQDEAHILIALLRMAGYPARYVCGLFVGEGATHAWVEYYDQGCWYGLDPTRDCLPVENYLVISYGRDYSDCPVERGVFRGDSCQLQTVFMQVREKAQ